MIGILAALARAQVPAGVGVDEVPGARVPLDVRLEDPEGRSATLGEWIDDRPTALVLAWYRCPMLCGVVGQGLASVRVELADLRWTALTVSFDPEDQPADADAARTRDRADWPFLVADPADLRRLTGALGFRARKQGDQWAHPTVMFVLTPDGRVAERLYGPRPDPVVLRRSLLDAGSGRIAAPARTWVDTCFRWDPASRTHGGKLLALLRLGVLATTTALVALVLWRVGRVRR